MARHTSRTIKLPNAYAANIERVLTTVRTTLSLLETEHTSEIQFLGCVDGGVFIEVVAFGAAHHELIERLVRTIGAYLDTCS